MLSVSFLCWCISDPQQGHTECLDSMGRKGGEKIGLLACHGMGGNQVIIYLLVYQHSVLCMTWDCNVVAVQAPEL